jgi:hypothetical protein
MPDIEFIRGEIERMRQDCAEGEFSKRPLIRCFLANFWNASSSALRFRVIGVQSSEPRTRIPTARKSAFVGSGLLGEAHPKIAHRGPRLPVPVGWLQR